MKRTFCALLISLLSGAASLQAQFSFTTNGNTIAIDGYSGPGGSLSIPATLNGLPVTSIGEYVFYNRYDLTNVTIPDSVTALGQYSFANTGLRNAALSENLNYAGVGAFESCVNLASISIPAA